MTSQFRLGDWMTTFTGKQFWPLDPRPEEVCIEDIAHALSLICRFGGHCQGFYSVAQHSCLVAGLVAKNEPDFVLSALLHDAAKAYVGDLIRPIKRTFEQFMDIEARVQLAINEMFGINPISHAAIKWADDTLLKNEHRCLVKDGREWSVDCLKCPQLEVIPLSSLAAEGWFLQMFNTWKNP